METTLVLVKPDGVQRGLIGSILARFEAKGLQIVGLRMLLPPTELLHEHYAVHRERPFFEGLVKFMSSSPVVALALRGEDAIAVVRRLVGPTDGKEAPPGTIRGDHGMSRSFNMVHASDALETAASEIALWFEDGLLEYDLGTLGWVYDPSDD